MQPATESRWMMPKSSVKQPREDLETITGKLTFLSVPVDQLTVDLFDDGGYQRGEASAENTRALSANLNWAAFACLIVGKRQNGRLYIADGGQRWRAAKLNGEKEVPCGIFESHGRQHEARVFYFCNNRRKFLRAVYKFSAAAMAGEQPERAISEWLKREGLEVAHVAHNETVIDFPSNLVVTWKLDKERTQAAVQLQREIVSPDTCHAQIHRAIFFLIRAGISIEEHVRRLRDLGGKGAILRGIRSVQIELGHKAANSRVCALGMLSVINYRKRQKIRLPESALESAE